MRRAPVVVPATALLMLSGCTSSDMETLPVTVSATPGAADQAAFLEQVKSAWAGTAPDDELLVGYGLIACTQLGDGDDPQDINFISDPDSSAGETQANTGVVIEAAGSTLCPEADQN